MFSVHNNDLCLIAGIIAKTKLKGNKNKSFNKKGQPKLTYLKELLSSNIVFLTQLMVKSYL